MFTGAPAAATGITQTGASGGAALGPLLFGVVVEANPHQLLVDERARFAALNAEHRGKDGPTDVLSFPIDGGDPSPGPCELGDIVICAAHTADLREAIVHGALHLTGMDHETDDGEMLALQAEILGWLR